MSDYTWVSSSVFEQSDREQGRHIFLDMLINLQNLQSVCLSSNSKHIKVSFSKDSLRTQPNKRRHSEVHRLHIHTVVMKVPVICF